MYNLSHHIFFLHLHSTMYLLKRKIHIELQHKKTFTFHYVSIKTDCSLAGIQVQLEFTFHYVSIKTALIALPALITF